MNTVQKTLLAGVVAVLLLPVSGSAQKVETDYDHSANFTQYHTYTWGHVASSDPLFESRIRDAVDHALEAKGWRLAPEGADADVTVAAVAMEKNKKEYTTFYDGLGPGWRWHGWGMGMATTSVEDVPVGNSDRRPVQHLFQGSGVERSGARYALRQTRKELGETRKGRG
jgi:hypothetical protein